MYETFDIMDLMQADDLRNTFDIQDGSLPFFRVFNMHFQVFVFIVFSSKIWRVGLQQMEL
jgi:hypothetical protein